MWYFFYYFCYFYCSFRYSDFVQVRVEIILLNDSSRFRYSTGYVFLAKSKFGHDLKFDFFLFELLPPFLIVDFCCRTLDLYNSLVCNALQLVTVCNSSWRGQFDKIWSHLTTYPAPTKKTTPPPTYLPPTTYLPPPTPLPTSTYPQPWTEKNLTLFMWYLSTIFVISVVHFRCSDFFQVRVEIILLDDSSRLRYSTGYVFSRKQFCSWLEFWLLCIRAFTSVFDCWLLVSNIRL